MLTADTIAELTMSDDPTIAALARHAQASAASCAGSCDHGQRLLDRMATAEHQLEQIRADKARAEVRYREAVETLWDVTKWCADVLEVDVEDLRVSAGMDPEAIPSVTAVREFIPDDARGAEGAGQLDELELDRAVGDLRSRTVPRGAAGSPVSGGRQV